MQLLAVGVVVVVVIVAVIVVVMLIVDVVHQQRIVDVIDETVDINAGAVVVVVLVLLLLLVLIVALSVAVRLKHKSAPGRRRCQRQRLESLLLLMMQLMMMTVGFATRSWPNGVAVLVRPSINVTAAAMMVVVAAVAGVAAAAAVDGGAQLFQRHGALARHRSHRRRMGLRLVVRRQQVTNVAGRSAHLESVVGTCGDAAGGFECAWWMVNGSV